MNLGIFNRILRETQIQRVLKQKKLALISITDKMENRYKSRNYKDLTN